MKELPILFSGPMVRAILDGRKTQTRRVLRSTVFVSCGCGEPWPSVCDRHGPPRFSTWERCQFGQPGDRLWVREKWATDPCYDHIAPRDLMPHWTIRYASGETVFTPGFHRCRSSIHMPRWASRLTLEVVSVRIERVQDISEADAVAEGVDGCGVSWWGGVMSGTARVMRANAVIAFHDLWDSINAPRGFGRDANPWVRVVEFKTLQLRGSNV